MATLSERMVEYRAKERISMAEAAERAGVALSTWMHCERELQKASRVTIGKIEQLLRKEE